MAIGAARYRCQRSFAILFVLTLVSFSVGPHSALASTAIDRILEKKVLTVAMFSEDVPPFFYHKDDKLVGIDPELAQDIGRKLGVEVVFNRNADTFDGIVDEVAEGRADIAISLMSDTLDRALRVSFSDSYVSVRQYLLINRLELGKLIAADRNDSPIPTLLNRKGSRIGVISGTSYVGFLRDDFPNAEMAEFEGWDHMLAAVKAGELVALMYDEIEIGNWRAADPAGSLELRPYHLKGHPDTIAIGVRKDEQDLKAWIDLYLKKANENGFLPGLLKTHLYSSDRSLND